MCYPAWTYEAADTLKKAAARIEQLEAALEQVAAGFARGDGGPNLINFNALSVEFGRRQIIAAKALQRR